MGFQLPIAAGSRPNQRHHGRGMGENALGKVTSGWQESFWISQIEKSILPCAAIKQTDVEVAAAACSIKKWLGHKRGLIAQAVSNFFGGQVT